MKIPAVLLLLCATLAHAFAHAQVIAQAHVFVEEDATGESVRCNVSTEIIAASVEAALRFNKISVVGKTAEVDIYVNPNILSISSDNRCIANISLDFRKYGPIRVEHTGRSIFGVMSLCRQGGVMLMNRSNIQREINDALRGMVDVCVSRIEKAGR